MNGSDTIKKKEEYETIGFRVYLYHGFNPSQEARGTVALLNKKGTQIDKAAYNHWDEIPQMMRRLLRRNKNKDKFFKRRCKISGKVVKEI